MRERLARSGAAKPAVPTFTKDVAPILYKNCTDCHRPGEIGPMSLLTYKDARPSREGRSATRSATARCRRGTPIRRTASSLNDRSLSDEGHDRCCCDGPTTARRKGDDKDLPPAPKYVDGWSIGTAGRGHRDAGGLPGAGRRLVEYQYFEIPTKLTEDVGAGARSAARRARRRPPRHRDGPCRRKPEPTAGRVHVREGHGHSERADRSGRSRKAGRPKHGKRQRSVPGAAAARRVHRRLRARARARSASTRIGGADSRRDRPSFSRCTTRRPARDDRSHEGRRSSSRRSRRRPSCGSARCINGQLTFRPATSDYRSSTPR